MLWSVPSLLPTCGLFFDVFTLLRRRCRLEYNSLKVVKGSDFIGRYQYTGILTQSSRWTRYSLGRLCHSSWMSPQWLLIVANHFKKKTMLIIRITTMTVGTYLLHQMSQVRLLTHQCPRFLHTAQFCNYLPAKLQNISDLDHILQNQAAVVRE